MRSILINIIKTSMINNWGQLELPDMIADDILKIFNLKIIDKSQSFTKNGLTYGRLTVIGKVADMKPTRFICRCSCGQIKEVAYSNLTSGATKSCGCLKRDRKSIPVGNAEI